MTGPVQRPASTTDAEKRRREGLATDEHDHGPTAQLLGTAWCLTCQHDHIATIPSTTFRCAGGDRPCGFGCWGVTVAAAHAATLPDHVVYPVLHQMVAAPPAPEPATATLTETERTQFVADLRQNLGYAINPIIAATLCRSVERILAARQPATVDAETLADREAVAGVIAKAIDDEQTYAGVEHRRRVGYRGRLSIARLAADRLAEHASAVVPAQPATVDAETLAERIEAVLRQRFGRKSDGGQFTYLTAHDFRLGVRELANAITSAVVPAPEGRKNYGRLTFLNLSPTDIAAPEGDWPAAVFIHGDHGVCLYNAASGAWYANDDGATLHNPRPICEREHPSAAPVAVEGVETVEWAHLLDDAGSADMYDTEDEARQMLAICGGGLARVVMTIVTPVEPETSEPEGGRDA